MGHLHFMPDTQLTGPSHLAWICMCAIVNAHYTYAAHVLLCVTASQVATSCQHLRDQSNVHS